MTDLDSQIEKAHSAAERIEDEARQVEARIVSAGGVPPQRPYGRQVDPESVRRNLTLAALLSRRDPKLAAYLGVGTDYHRRRDEEAAVRAASAQAIAAETERLKTINDSSRRYREQQQLAGINPLTGRRWGQ